MSEDLMALHDAYMSSSSSRTLRAQKAFTAGCLPTPVHSLDRLVLGRLSVETTNESTIVHQYLTGQNHLLNHLILI